MTVLYLYGFDVFSEPEECLGLYVISFIVDDGVLGEKKVTCMFRAVSFPSMLIQGL